MKKIIISLSIFLLVLCPFLLSGCDKPFNPNLSLTSEQQQVYNEVENYAMSCNSSEEKEEVLYQIKLDIKQSSNDKLDIELSIGKLKIDKLNLKNKLESDIAYKERTAASNKISYKNQRDSIYNIYQGTQSSYNSQVSLLQNKINQAYSTYLTECQRINSSNMGDGYKELYRQNAYQTYINSVSTYNSQLSQLNTQWQNKLNYDKYNKLYNEVDLTLQKDIQSLQSKYQNDCSKLDTQINNLIRQR